MQGRPFSRVEIESPAQNQPMRLVTQVPVNVSLPAGVRLQTGDADPGQVVAFNRRVTAGCFAEFALSQDSLKKFRRPSGSAKLTFTDAAGQKVDVPVSFKGFSPAFDALVKQ